MVAAGTLPPDVYLCPAWFTVSDGVNSIDLLCWRDAGHKGPHTDSRSDPHLSWSPAERHA